jgi:hypothetical protein
LAENYRAGIGAFELSLHVAVLGHGTTEAAMAFHVNLLDHSFFFPLFFFFVSLFYAFG